MVIADAGLNGASGHRWSTGLDLLTDDASSAAFQPFLGTNHKHYGWIDQFYVGTQSNGLSSLRLRRSAHSAKASHGAPPPTIFGTPCLDLSSAMNSISG